MGEPERLSLDDWWNPEEKLRLLCIGAGGVCLDSFFKMLRRRLQCETGTVNSMSLFFCSMIISDIIILETSK